MAVSTQLQVAILAANYLGEEDTGGALSDSSNIGVNRMINERFDAAARYILTRHDWAFAHKRTVLRTLADTAAISAGDTATPSLFTSATHGLAVNDLVRMSDLVVATELNDKDFLVNTVPLTTTFTLKENTADQDVVTASGIETAGIVRKKPAFRWNNAYDVPTDNLRILTVDASAVGWDLEQEQILTDNTNIEVEYLYDYDFASAGQLVDEHFNDALALRLAFEISVVINQDESKQRDLERKVEVAIKRARFIDSTKRGRIIQISNDFERARLTSSRFNDQTVGKLFGHR